MSIPDLPGIDPLASSTPAKGLLNLGRGTLPKIAAAAIAILVIAGIVILIKVIL